MSIDPFTSVLNLGQSVIERIWPDANKRAEEMRKLEELKQRGDLAELDAHVKLLVGQMEINKTEAAHPSIFVSGWRPATGWCCVLGLFYHIIAVPFFSIWYTMPLIELDLLDKVLMGMLGLSTLRTYEKHKGVNRE